MMKQIFSGWSAMRIIRLALGLLVIYQAAEVKEWLAVFLGVAVVLMALTNTGCCGGTACIRQTRISDNGITNTGDAVFEEIK